MNAAPSTKPAESAIETQLQTDADALPAYTPDPVVGERAFWAGGCASCHATPVEGRRQRIQAILGYSTRPGLLGNKESSILHYGPRVAEIEANNPKNPRQVVIG